MAQIFEHLDSMDLIRLERTPVVRNMVVGNDRAYRAQATMSGLPEFQSKDWPLRKWFHLIFEKECMVSLVTLLAASSRTR